MNQFQRQPGETHPFPQPFRIHRRRFLQTASAGLALSALGAYGADLVKRNRRNASGSSAPAGMARAICGG